MNNKQAVSSFIILLVLFVFISTAQATTNNFEFGAGYFSGADGSEIELLELGYFDSGNENFFPSKLEFNLGDRSSDDFKQNFNTFNISLLKKLDFIPGNTFLGLGFKSLNQTEHTSDYKAEKKAYTFPVRLISKNPIYKNIAFNSDFAYYPYGHYSTNTDNGFDFEGDYSGYEIKVGIEYSFSNSFSLYSNYNYKNDDFGESLTGETPIAGFSDTQTGIVTGINLEF